MNAALAAEPERMTELRQRARQVATQMRLPFRTKVWRGLAGNWLGAGIGSSIDFQDHRPYLPGDDPRYIDWQAYARSGHYTMKLYREEVSPRVDLVFDVSASMAITDAKRLRSLELFFFALESALQSAASVRLWLVSSADVWRKGPEEMNGASWLPEAPGFSAHAESRPPNLDRIPWRAGTLRVFVSDLLYPGSPEAPLRSLLAGKGHAVLLAPFDPDAEASPAWQGNIRFLDCETSAIRDQRVESSLLSAYAQAYRRHFDLWKAEAFRRGAVLARITSRGALIEALKTEAVPSGAVEFCN
jgi:hypothetical protein